MTATTTSERASPPEAAPDLVRKGGWFTLWVMLLVTLFGFVDRQVLTLAAAPMAKELGLDDGQLGLVQGLAFAVFSVVAVYPIAWAADRFDRRIVVAACIATWSLGTTLCGLAQTFEQLFAAAVLIAAGEAGLTPIVFAVIPDLFSGRKRMLANALFYFFAYVGISLGLALGGLALGALDQVHAQLPAALEAFSSWRLSFFLVSLPAPLFMLLVGFATLRGSGSRPKPGVAKAPSGEFLAFLGSHGGTLGLLFTGIASYVLAFGGYFAWLPVASTRLFAATPSENGLAMALAVGVGMIGGVTLGMVLVRRLVARHGAGTALRVVWMTLLAGTPLLLAFPFITAAWQGYVLFGGLMVVGTAVGSLLPGVLQDIAPENLRARVIALNTIIQGLIGGSAPTLVGWVSGALGSDPRGLLVAITMVSVPSWVLAFLLLRLSQRPFADLARLVATPTQVPSRA